LSKHTPGPWEVYPFITSQVTGDEVSEAGPDTFIQFRVQTAAEHCCLADVIQSPADARLIAAAPELLSALEMIRDADNDCAKDRLPRIPSPARARIDAAIAKARGDK
jgi:hypothetical protein